MRQVKFVIDSNSEELSLLQALSRGEENALKKLAEKYYRSLFLYGAKLGADTDDVRDAIQDIYLHLWLKKESVQTIGSIRAYLFASLRNNLLKTVKFQMRHTDLSHQFSKDDENEAADERMIQSENNVLLKQHLEQTINQLPKRQREVLYLRYYESLSYEEIGEVMALNKQSVANYLQYALGKIRVGFKKKFIYLLLLFQLLTGI